jgi:hypothetical protein
MQVLDLLMLFPPQQEPHIRFFSKKLEAGRYVVRKSNRAVEHFFKP